MDFGEEDDEDWDANELEALEVEAVHTYAATQQKTQIAGAEPVDQTRSNHEIQQYDLTGLEDERESKLTELEKLVQTKQGELLILRSNIAKTSAEHAAVLESIKTASRAVQDDLARQVRSCKDKITRLETDLTFQQQELKEAKLSANQLGKPTQGSPRSTRVQGKNGAFPDRSTFERDDGNPVQLGRTTARKRRRIGNLAEEAALDDFDLAEERVRQKAELQTSTLMTTPPPCDVMAADQEQSMNFDLPDIHMREASVSTANSFGNLDQSIKQKRAELLFAEIRDYTFHTTDMHGQNCIETLMRVRNPDDELERSIAQCLIDVIFSSINQSSPELLLERSAHFILSQITHPQNPETIMCLLRLLQSYLQIEPLFLGSYIIRSAEVSSGFIATLSTMINGESPQALRTLIMSIMERVSDCLNRATETCRVMLNQISPGFARAILCTSKDEFEKSAFLRTLAKLCATEVVLHNSMEMLDLISIALEKDDVSLMEITSRRQIVLQCLYCVVVYCENGIDQVRRSRHVIPRLVRRLARELDDLYDTPFAEHSRTLIRMLVKLYHILMKEETNATSEQHWRSPEMKALHLTTMTRILYAEEHDRFDSNTQDLAMDMLEMAVSPEEGNDIYEVMGGIVSE